jgi:imidazolonepropionase-like amidohydrolase
MIAVKKIPQVSTLTIGDGYSRLVDNPDFLDQPLYRATLDPAMIIRLKTEVRDRYAERRWTQWMKVMTPVAQENLRKVHEVGGIVALGTDQSLGAATHRELELLVAAGISPADAIKIGTLHSAMALGKENELGTIEVGKLADLVILNADPTKDIQNAKRIDTVIKNGRPVDRDSLRIPVNAESTTP